MCFRNFPTNQFYFNFIGEIDVSLINKQPEFLSINVIIKQIRRNVVYYQLSPTTNYFAFNFFMLLFFSPTQNILASGCGISPRLQSENSSDWNSPDIHSNNKKLYRAGKHYLYRRLSIL